MSAINDIKSKFGEKIEVFERSKRRTYINVYQKDIAVDIVELLFKELGARLSTISAVDLRGGIELLYHMTCDKEGLTISVRTTARKPAPKIESITGFIEGADWIEREIHELFGVLFIGHPNLKGLLLPDDWPEGEYPLRKKTFESESEVKEI